MTDLGKQATTSPVADGRGSSPGRNLPSPTSRRELSNKQTARPEPDGYRLVITRGEGFGPTRYEWELYGPTGRSLRSWYGLSRWSIRVYVKRWIARQERQKASMKPQRWEYQI